MCSGFSLWGFSCFRAGALALAGFSCHGALPYFDPPFPEYFSIRNGTFSIDNSSDPHSGSKSHMLMSPPFFFF